MAISLTNPQFKKLTATPENRTYTVAVVTVVVVVLLVFFAIRPSIASVFDRLNENEKKRDFIDQMQTKQQNLVTLTNLETSQATQLDLLDNAFPQERTENAVLENIAELAIQNNVEFKAMDLTVTEEKSNIGTDLDVNTQHSIVTLAVSGPRANIWNLVGDMENSNRILNIQEVGVGSRIDAQGNVDKISDAEIVFEIYYYQKPNV